jgi:hypothetical protein
VTPDARVATFSGASFVGRYTFDSTEQNQSPSIPGFGSYDASSFISFGNGYQLTSTGNYIRVFSGGSFSYAGYDFIISGGTQPSGFPGLIFNGASFYNRDFSGKAISSTALPLSPPDLSAFDYQDSLLNFIDPAAHENVNVDLHIDKLTLQRPSGFPEPTTQPPQQVAEPNAVGLVSFGFMAAVWVRSRRRT